MALQHEKLFEAEISDRLTRLPWTGTPLAYVAVRAFWIFRSVRAVIPRFVGYRPKCPSAKTSIALTDGHFVFQVV
jgi:hypothetical protein